MSSIALQTRNNFLNIVRILQKSLKHTINWQINPFVIHVPKFKKKDGKLCFHFNTRVTKFIDVVLWAFDKDTQTINIRLEYCFSWFVLHFETSSRNMVHISTNVKFQTIEMVHLNDHDYTIIFLHVCNGTANTKRETKSFTIIHVSGLCTI